MELTENFVTVEGARFVKGSVSLDNIRFVRCLFGNATLIYSGGPVIFEQCKFEGRSGLIAQGAARYAFEVLNFLRTNATLLDMPPPAGPVV